MSEVKPELKQCSRCHSNCTLEHYEKNRKGEWFNLCINCRAKKREEKNTYRELKGEKLREKERAYARQYRKDNTDKIEESNTYWITKHADKYKDEIEGIKQGLCTDNQTVDIKQIAHILIQKLHGHQVN